MRTKYSILNSAIGMLYNIVLIIIGLIFQKSFIVYLGNEYLGLNGLFQNIISMLAIAELGIGSAIIYSMYRPIAEGDTSKIYALMQFYKLSYRKVALSVLAIGLIFIPFLQWIVGEYQTLDINITLVYLLFLADSIMSYLLIYKQSIIIANQKNYITLLVTMVYNISLRVIQIIIMKFTQNYYLFLIVAIVLRFISNIVLSRIADRMYPFLKEKRKSELELKERQGILIRVKALIFHKIGAFAILGSDSIIISTLSGLITVGFYSNYKMIIGHIQSFANQIFSSLTASVGNLLVTENVEYSYSIYRKIRLMNYWIAVFTASCIFICMQDFICLWVGKEFLFSLDVLLCLVINYYFQLMRTSTNSFKEAAGIFYEDRFVPFIELSVNIVSSIVFFYMFGVAGIFLGTILSNLVLHLFSYPKYVIKGLFHQSIKEYYFNFIKEFILFICVLTICTFLSSYIQTNSYLLDFLLKGITGSLISNMILIFIFHKSEEYRYYKTFIFRMFKRLFHK